MGPPHQRWLELQRRLVLRAMQVFYRYLHFHSIAHHSDRGLLKFSAFLDETTKNYCVDIINTTGIPTLVEIVKKYPNCLFVT